MIDANEETVVAKFRYSAGMLGKKKHRAFVEELRSDVSSPTPSVLKER